MSDYKGTRGPWHIRTLDGSKWTIDDENDNSVAQAQQVKPLPDDLLQIERTANARLIAAAPELLEAADIGLRYIEAVCFNTQNAKKRANYADAASKIRAAIAKATEA